MTRETFNQLKGSLTDSDCNQLLRIVKAKESQTGAMRDQLLNNGGGISPYPLLDRLTRDQEGNWSFQPGMDERTDLRHLREMFKGEL